MSEDAPQLTPSPDESHRIEDPEKAHEMALAGDEYRTNAAIYRQYETETASRAADESDYAASELEDEAGIRHDADQTRVQDPDKAYEMASAGDKNRSRAVNYRRAAETPFFGGPGTAGESNYLEQAKSEDRKAVHAEEAAGRQYDREHTPVNADEVIDVLSALREHDESGEGTEYIENDVIWNEDWGTNNPDLYKEIYEKLSSSEDDYLRRTAAIGISHIFAVDWTTGEQVLERLVSDNDFEVLDALTTQLDIKRVIDKGAGLETNLTLLKGYTEAVRRKKELEQSK